MSQNGLNNLWAGFMSLLMLALLGFVFQLSVRMGDFRVDVERRFGEVNVNLVRMEERLARIEAILEQRFDPDPVGSVGNGNGP